MAMDGGTTLIAPHALSAATDADLIAIPASSSAREPSAELVEVLRAAHERGAWILSVCSGAFTLAAAGLLDDRDCTTHWFYADELAAFAPKARVDPNVLYAQDGRIITSAGTAAGIAWVAWGSSAGCWAAGCDPIVWAPVCSVPAAPCPWLSSWLRCSHAESF